MKPKNVMLLGFVNRAVEYLDKHMDEEPDTRLAQLKNIDLASLKDELSDNLDASLGTMQSTMTTLLKAGNEAFDEFLNTKQSSQNFTDQFDKMFDIDFEDDNENKQNDLAKLLSYYNLDDDFDYSQEINTLIDESIKQPTSIEDDNMMDEIRKNAARDDISEIIEEQHSKESNEEIDSIFSEIVENEKQPMVDPLIHNDYVSDNIINTTTGNANIVGNNVVNNVAGNDLADSKPYVSSLIEDLKKQLKREEVQKKEESDKNKEIYEHISRIYPYLPDDFVKDVYSLKDSISEEYPNDDELVVLHRIAFGDVENLRQFAEIGLNHDYQINADENKLIVDIFKEFTNSDGKILNNIFEIANQGYLLNGRYEGYKVITNLNEE